MLPGDTARVQLFLSTPSARRATVTRHTSAAWPIYFYPRPPRGGRPREELNHLEAGHISIHALREEGDYQLYKGYRGPETISIHALREEGDGIRA